MAYELLLRQERINVYHPSNHSFISIAIIVLLVSPLLNNTAFSQKRSLTFSPLFISASIAHTTTINNSSTLKQINNVQDASIVTKLLADNLKSRLHNAGAVLNITSKLLQANSTSFAHLLNCCTSVHR